MEMLAFYSLNILVGCVMGVVLGLYGRHMVGRNKTLETLMIGQTMQFGIILGVFIISTISHHTGAIHENHLGLITSLVLAQFVYMGYNQLSKKWYFLKTELALFFIIFAIVFGHIFTALNPLIESHMVRSFVGDIVTASRGENFFLLALTIVSGVVYWKQRARYMEDTIELGLYGFSHNKTVMFEIIIFLLMSISIHVFGLLFSLGMMLIPITFFNIIGHIQSRTMSLLIVVFNSLAVVLGFVLSVTYERLPTSPTILVVLALMYLLLCFFPKEKPCNFFKLG